MTDSDIVRYRLANQQICQPMFTKPAELVAWLGAVQGQDFLAAKWALGLRLPTTTETAIDQAIADRSVVRTWAMRGTLHLIAADDVRWILNLLRPRLHILSASYLRRLELDEKKLTKSYDAMTNALSGGKQLIRQELNVALAQAGIPTHDIRMNLLLVRAASDGLICCGVRRGSENTYTLLDEWIAPTKPRERDDALAELTKRYFLSHGPATLQDFVWWSGLTVAEAKAGIHSVKEQLIQEMYNKQTYWMAQHERFGYDTSLAVHLLPSFDEYLVGYKNRTAALGSLDFKQIVSAGNGIFSPVIVVDGRVAGTWKRTVQKNTVLIETNLFNALSATHQEGLDLARERYARFKELAVYGR